MSTPSESEPPNSPQPWWAGSRPAWRSPWSLDEEDGLAGEAPGGGADKPEAPAPVVAKADERAARESEAVPRPRQGVTGAGADTRGEGSNWMHRPVEALRKVVVARSSGRQAEQAPKTGMEGVENEPDAAESGGWSRRAGTFKRTGTTWTSLIFMAMAVLALTFVAWLYVTDTGEVEDKDIRVAAPRDLLPHITAPGRLEVFLGSVKPVPAAELAGKAAWEWDSVSMMNWLVANSQALDNLKDLLEDFDWHGRHASWHFTDLGSHPNWGAAVKLKQVEAAFMQRDGKQEAAMEAALDLAEMARRLQDILAWPSFYFRALETHERCTDTLADLLQRSAAGEDALASFQQQFEACEPKDAHVRDNVLPGFYLFEKKVLLGALSGESYDTLPGGLPRPAPKQLFFKTNETLGVMAATVRHLMHQVGQTSVQSGALRAVWSRAQGEREVAAYQPNGRGVVYARARLEPYLDVPARHQLARTRHLLVAQLFAMRRFVAREKGLPVSLGALRPLYLKELPLDPYSGEPFHYNPQRGVIFSVGRDVTAAGGRADLPPLSDADEPTVRIGVQSAPAGR